MSTIAVPENAPSMQLAHERDVYIRYIETLCELYPSSGFYLRKLAEYLRTPSDWNRGMPGAICVEVDPLARHQPQLSQFSARPSNPRFVIVEGFPAPETIAKVGSRYSVRPELFLGHLEIERTQHSERTSFELPTLPSLRGDIVHVRLIRLARSSRNRSDKWDSGAARINANRLCHNFEEKLFRESRFGTTRVRKINAHGEKYFSVEQMVSFSVAQTSNEPWTGLFLLDRGHDLVSNHLLPWADYTSNSDNTPVFLPAVAYNSRTKYKHFPTLLAGHHLSERSTVHPYHPLVDSLEEDEATLLGQDPFFILSRLLNTAILSWVQMLNFLEDDITACQTADEDESASALKQLRFNTTLIHRFETYISGDLSVIKMKSSFGWPAVTKIHLVEKMDSICSNLVMDYEELLSRCQGLLKRCEAGTGLLLSTAQMVETHKSQEQARQVNVLTTLAVGFVPVSVVTSAFGMNVKEISAHSPPVWAFVLVALGVSAFTFLGLWLVKKEYIAAFRR